ncbi:flagellar hook-associated protein FlgL [Vibrio astriarenae]
MLNRISSFHNYQSVQNDMRRQEGKIHQNHAQLASGKQLVKASDDPLASHYIQSISQQNTQLDHYIEGVTLSRNRLNHEEVLLDNAEQFTDSAKRSVMEMINGAFSPQDRAAKAQEMQELANNFLNLVNVQDESGNYIFAGTKPRHQPFYRDAQGSVTYVGDDYQRKMKISNNMEIAMNDPGSKVFMEIPNPYGDYSANYSLTSSSELLLERAENANSSDLSVYNITFVDMGNGQFGYQLEQNGVAVKVDTYDPTTGIEFGDLSVQFRGQIAAGDKVELDRRETFSVFDSLRDAIDYSEGSVSDASNTAHLHQVTEELSAAFVHLGQVRTEVGTRLSTLDIQEDQHKDFQMSLAKSKSNFEDLDYSKAVIEFSENSRALQASQLAFGKTKDLSLFNYL